MRYLLLISCIMTRVLRYKLSPWIVLWSIRVTNRQENSVRRCCHVPWHLGFVAPLPIRRARRTHATKAAGANPGETLPHLRATKMTSGGETHVRCRVPIVHEHFLLGALFSNPVVSCRHGSPGISGHEHLVLLGRLALLLGVTSGPCQTRGCRLRPEPKPPPTSVP